MKLKITIYIVIWILFLNKIYANSDINELKKSSVNRISEVQKKFLSIKNKIISPYNKKQFPYESYLDSLYFLSEKLDKRRKNMFSELKRLDLSINDIQFFDNLNRDSILMYNIINGFARSYNCYLSSNNIDRVCSFETYNFETKKLLALEKIYFSSKIRVAKK